MPTQTLFAYDNGELINETRGVRLFDDGTVEVYDDTDYDGWSDGYHHNLTLRFAADPAVVRAIETLKATGKAHIAAAGSVVRKSSRYDTSVFDDRDESQSTEPRFITVDLAVNDVGELQPFVHTEQELPSDTAR